MTNMRLINPRRSHRKSRNGCTKCKERKVKCDEVHPICGACSKYGETCIYERPSSLNAPTSKELYSQAHDQTIGSSSFYSPNASNHALQPASRHQDTSNSRNVLEFELLHHFVVYSCETFSPRPEPWSALAPTIAFKHEFLLDAMLMTAALHLERSGAANADIIKARQDLFQKTLKGYQQALSNLSEANFEATLLTAGLISIHMFAQLSAQPSKEPEKPEAAILGWLRIGEGARLVSHNSPGKWASQTGILSSLNQEPTLTDPIMHAPENRKGVEHILEWGLDHEIMTENDRDAYQKALSVVGLIYQAANVYREPPLAITRRILVFPCCVPSRFAILVQQHRPRALVIMAYVLAAVKLVEGNVLWLDGVAERQLPIIESLLPPAWKLVMQDLDGMF